MRIAKKLGVEAIEIMWENSTKARAEEVKALLREYALRPSAMGVSGESTPADLDGFGKEFSFAAAIGCPYYIAHLSPLRYGDREAIESFRQKWLPICRLAGESGVQVLVQSCGLDPESWDIMLDAVPLMGLKYDPSFSVQAGRNYRMEVVKYGKFIRHVHSKDEIALQRTTDFASGIHHFRYVPSGMGDIHWGSIIALLYESGYTGDIAIEPHSEFWFGNETNLETCIRISKRHLEQYTI